MLWIKTFHILFVIAWMAGIFYLPRILVHYVEGRAAGEDVRRLVTMAQRLFAFMTVMAVIAVGTGLWLLLYGFNGGWLHAKLTLVGLLGAYHAQLSRYTARMARDELLQRSLYFRILNEAALLLVIPILILVVVKPF